MEIQKDIQVVYPKKHDLPHWDPVRLEYPIRKFPSTNQSSETIARRWQRPAEIIKTNREPIEELREYLRDYNITKELTRSQTTEHYGFKEPTTKKFNKHTSCEENRYIYPLPRKLEERPPQCSAHGTTEMRSAYTEPNVFSRLVTDKDQFKHPASLPDQHYEEPSFHKDLEPIDTTHDGYEKYLDPYLTTSRLHHRPYTADQLNRISNSKDIVTYYTLAKTPWKLQVLMISKRTEVRGQVPATGRAHAVHYLHEPFRATFDPPVAQCLLQAWSAKPKIENWNLPLRRPKSMYDREKFKQDFREIRTHNQLQWVPRTFRTESRDNYVPQDTSFDVETEVRNYYKRAVAKISTKHHTEQSLIKNSYGTENSSVGSGKPLCSIFDPYVEKNKVLERMETRQERSG